MRRRGQIAYPATKRRGVHHLTVVYVFFFAFFRVVAAVPAAVAAPRAKVAAPVPAAPATVVLWGEGVILRLWIVTVCAQVRVTVIGKVCLLWHEGSFCGRLAVAESAECICRKKRNVFYRLWHAQHKSITI